MQNTSQSEWFPILRDIFAMLLQLNKVKKQGNYTAVRISISFMLSSKFFWELLIKVLLRQEVSLLPFSDACALLVIDWKGVAGSCSFFHWWFSFIGCSLLTQRVVLHGHHTSVNGKGMFEDWKMQLYLWTLNNLKQLSM